MTRRPPAAASRGHSRRRLRVALLAVPALAAMTLSAWRLGDTPADLFIDEAAIALTARSLWENGTDLAGTSWPLYPLSFPDRDRPMPVNPIFTYSAIPFALQGPGGWSARLPAVLWLWICGAGIGLCAAELSKRRTTGVLAGACAVLTPWLFVPGRVGWEAVTFPAVMSWAFWCALRAVHRGSRGLSIASGVLFGLAVYAYSTARLVVPLTVAAILIIWLTRPATRRSGAWLAAAFALVLLPFLISLARDPRTLTWRFQEMSGADRAAAPGVPPALHVLSNMASYFSPGFLLLEGDPNPRHGTGSGVLPWAVSALALLGLAGMIRRRKDPAIWMVVVGWLLAPSGAALTAPAHALRSIGAAPFWILLAALGAAEIAALRPGRAGAMAGAVLGLALVTQQVIFVADYFGPYRHRSLEAFSSGGSVLIRKALALRGPGHLYLPPYVHMSPRLSVIPAYWARVPTTEWPPSGLDRFRIHAWGGQAPAGSLIIMDGMQAPPGGVLVDVERSAAGGVRYSLYRN